MPNAWKGDASISGGQMKDGAYRSPWYSTVPLRESQLDCLLKGSSNCNHSKPLGWAPDTWPFKVLGDSDAQQDPHSLLSAGVPLSSS